MKHEHLRNESGDRLAWVIRNVVKFYKRQKRNSKYCSPYQYGQEIKYKSHSEALKVAKEWVGV